MTSARDVLGYIQEVHPTRGETQCHKLLYYTQAWSLAWEGRPLFEDRIEAWKYGPVVPSVRYCSNVDAYVPLSKQQRDVVDAVLAYYGKCTSADLVALTHAETPWLAARGDLHEDAPSNAEITHESMLREYTRQSLRGEGPLRPVFEAEEPSLSEVLSLAAEVSETWGRTLDLLAR